VKLNTPDFYNVAWFKLAECIARGEKERALGVYKLLAHSLNDSALAIQLEADILLSFNKQDALAAYQRAAEEYKSQKQLFKAACIYEHMLTIDPTNNTYSKTLIELYTHLNMPHKIAALAYPQNLE